MYYLSVSIAETLHYPRCVYLATSRAYPSFLCHITFNFTYRLSYFKLNCFDKKESFFIKLMISSSV